MGRRGRGSLRRLGGGGEEALKDGDHGPALRLLFNLELPGGVNHAGSKRIEACAPSEVLAPKIAKKKTRFSKNPFHEKEFRFSEISLDSGFVF